MRDNLARRGEEFLPGRREDSPLSMEQGMLGRLKDVLGKADPRNPASVVDELERLHGAQVESVRPLTQGERNEIILRLKIFLGMNEGELPLRYPGGKTYILGKNKNSGITIGFPDPQIMSREDAFKEMEPLD